MNPVPQPPALMPQPDLVEQAVTRLSEAAHLIEQEEDQGKIDRKARPYSRVSRLAPIVDISADIRRESTPLPKISGAGESEPAIGDDPTRRVGYENSPAHVNSGSGMPDYWPWLDTDTEDKENDIWANSTDPLISRHVPTSAEAASIEEEDMQRAVAEGIPTAQFPIPFVRRHFSRMRIAFIALAIIALIALAVDSVLLNVAFNHSRYANGGLGGLPTLTLSSNAAKVNDTVTLKLEHFSHTANVALTHDVQEPISIDGRSTVATDATGTAAVPVVIDTTWGPGFHLIVAEDVTTRNTASATLQITGQGSTPPPHLLIDPGPIHMGSDIVGANSIRTFTLVNGGGGSITWSASSHQPWLLISPSQGIFSQGQTISLAVQRVGLKPKDYSGSITITTNVSVPQQLEVDMTVLPLPRNAGPVVALSPALLSFTTTDGGLDPSAQSLTISNPGSHPLSWSLAINDSSTTTTQWALSHAQGVMCNWLSATPTSGIVAPGASSVLSVNVQSQCLLPGTYLGILKFTGNGAIDGSQAVNVSLTVQPHCGLVTSTGSLAFTVVQGQNTLANQTMNLNATASCAGSPLPWTSTSSVSWLSITPTSGQLKGTASAAVSVSVNAANLLPKLYYGNLSFVTGQSTLTVMVQLNVQAPSSSSPIMGASPLSLNFSNTQGQPNPTGQVVTITNNGTSTLKWYSRVTTLYLGWLGASPSGGTIAPGQTGQVTINVDTKQLTPGSYVGQVVLNGMDARGNPAPGSPQTITVTLVVQPPCAISLPSSSSLSFSAVQGASTNLPPQTVMFTGTGNCVWPVNWTTNITPTANWLALTALGGTVKGTGQSGSIGVGANITGLPAGTYSSKVIIAANDASGAAAQGSPQSFTVTLTVLPPCVLSAPSPGSLSFTVAQGTALSSVQNVTVSETGTCARPVTWTASTGSTAWLVLLATAGTDSGSGGTIGVNINAATLLPGTYTGAITITATDSTGATVSGSGQAIPVTVTVTGFTVSGTVVACPGSTPPTCTAPQALPGASVTVLSGGTTVATTTADASGNFAFANIALGAYTISVAGSDASGTHYVGSLALTLTGNAISLNVQAFPG